MTKISLKLQTPEIPGPSGRDVAGYFAVRAHGKRLRIPVRTRSILGGSWVVISRVISRVTILITHIKGLITLLITTPEPPSSRQQCCDCWSG